MVDVNCPAFKSPHRAITRIGASRKFGLGRCKYSATSQPARYFVLDFAVAANQQFRGFRFSTVGTICLMCAVAHVINRIHVVQFMRFARFTRPDKDTQLIQLTHLGPGCAIWDRPVTHENCSIKPFSSCIPCQFHEHGHPFHLSPSRERDRVRRRISLPFVYPPHQPVKRNWLAGTSPNRSRPPAGITHEMHE